MSQLSSDPASQRASVQSVKSMLTLKPEKSHHRRCMCGCMSIQKAAFASSVISVLNGLALGTTGFLLRRTDSVLVGCVSMFACMQVVVGISCLIGVVTRDESVVGTCKVLMVFQYLIDVILWISMLTAIFFVFRESGALGTLWSKADIQWFMVRRGTTSSPLLLTLSCVEGLILSILGLSTVWSLASLQEQLRIEAYLQGAGLEYSTSETASEILRRRSREVV
ncbi:MAG: uncharacterized protein KVP18_001887 [Porospora cf. gigantea A]|uniref:uncharacterized protein n=2 Tax=Porospora cf. gigantea A TaxID=2853593 RepID=UPI00355A46FD|nr:MAG: hypothetical protein KVP18_001887 [Porospora cf. gigantea A]